MGDSEFMMKNREELMVAAVEIRVEFDVLLLPVKTLWVF